jgi:hypothetical protein
MHSIDQNNDLNRWLTNIAKNPQYYQDGIDRGSFIGGKKNGRKENHIMKVVTSY